VNDVDGRAVVVLEVRGPHKPYRTKGAATTCARVRRSRTPARGSCCA
jgi:hypothetical protein